MGRVITFARPPIKICGYGGIADTIVLETIAEKRAGAGPVTRTTRLKEM